MQNVDTRITEATSNFIKPVGKRTLELLLLVTFLARPSLQIDSARSYTGKQRDFIAKKNFFPNGQSEI